jgi:hypothetical protein
VEAPLHVSGQCLELPDESAASSKQILDRPIVALEALVDEIADALVLDAERRALPEVEQPREPLVQFIIFKRLKYFGIAQPLGQIVGANSMRPCTSVI